MRAPHSTRRRLMLTFVSMAMSLAACDVGQSSTSSASGSESAETTGYEPPDPEQLARCDDADLQWLSARKTHYTSYPEPGSPECEDFNGCEWEGLFSGCNGKQAESWVAANDIAAVYPMFEQLEHHELCIRSGSRVMIVNVIDTCHDSDCNGCCSQNQANFDALIDLESHTDERWGLPDDELQWADLGPRATPICP